MQNLDKQIWRSRITIPTKLKLYNTCILPIFLYGSECWAVTKRDVLKIDALDQWCLRILLGIKWYHHVWNDEVRRTTGQPRLSAIVQARRLSLFSYIARMPDKTDARSIITASPLENWRKPPGRPRTTWMKTIQQDLRSNNLSLDEAITVAQNRPLWRLMRIWRYAPLVVHATQEEEVANISRTQWCHTTSCYYKFPIRSEFSCICQ